MERTIKGYCRLFYEMFIISAFTFGGGFVIVSLMRKKFVEGLHWLSDEEMLDLAAIAQSSPGAIAVNAAIILGWRMGGALGVICAVTATIIPPIIVISVLSVFYAAFCTNAVVGALLKGMRAGVAAVIADVVLSLGWDVLKKKKLLYVILMAAAFVATYFFGVNAVLIIIICALAGIAAAVYKMKREGGSNADIS